MRKSFLHFLAEAEQRDKTTVFTFGRFNPPTIGHAKVLDAVYKTFKRAGKNAEIKIYASQSTDKKSNPLQYSEKIKFMRKMFPQFGRNIIEDKSIRHVFDVVIQLYNNGTTTPIFVVGSDRVSEFEKLLNKYNLPDLSQQYYFPNGVMVVSAGERDPDSNKGVQNVSASRARQYAIDGDYSNFANLIPANFAGGKELYNAVRKGLGLEEQKPEQLYR